MERKLYDQINKRAALLDEAKVLLDGGDMAGYQTKMADATAMNAEIEALRAFDAERGRFDAGDQGMLALENARKQTKQDAETMSALDSARAGGEYARAFADALKNGVGVKTGRGVEAYNPLYNALTIGGGTPAGADGGFLVPVEFDNLIHRRMKDFIRLSDFFNSETVSGLTGWRAIEKAKASKSLPEIDEAASITPDDQPSFEKVTYAVKKYGDILVVSSELADDNTAGLMQYLAEWFAPKVVLTENKLLLALLDGLVPSNIAAGSEVKDIKRALNKGLNTAYSRAAALLCNQDSYSHLDELEDANRRGLLVPDPTAPDTYRFKGRPVTYADNDLLPSREVTTAGATKGSYFPIYIGDFRSFGTLFRRKALEFASTNVGGNAWRSDTTEVRGIVRMDAKKIITEAAIKREIFIAAT